MTRPLAWVNRDSWLLIWARAARTFAQSTISVLLAVYFGLLGLSLVEVGVFLTIGSIGATCMAVMAGLFGDSFGRRRFLITVTVLMALSGTVIVVSGNFVLLFAAALIGGMGPLVGNSWPLEQAMVAISAESGRRTDLFGIFSIAAMAAASLGALGAGIPEVLLHSFPLSQLAAFRAWLIIYPLFVLSAAFLYSRVSSHVEVSGPVSNWNSPFKLSSRRRMFTLGGLFMVDSFSGGMIGQSLASYFFFTKFGLQPAALGALFFASNIITTISLWVATRLARRIGLLNTMVFTHIPASLFLIAVPFVPSVWMAIVLWLVRAFFIQMDAPTSQSYTMSVVKPEERTAMASVATVSRSAGTTVGPSVGTALWSTFGDGVFFIFIGTVKIAYDIALWLFFRQVKPPEESTVPGKDEVRT